MERGGPVRVRTAHGVVKARFAIVACNAYIGDLEPQLAARSMPCGPQVIATEPLRERWREILPFDQCVEDNNYLLDYYRLSADRRLPFGGGVIYGARDPTPTPPLPPPPPPPSFPPPPAPPPPLP